MPFSALLEGSKYQAQRIPPMNLEILAPSLANQVANAPKKGIGRPKKMAHRHPLAPYPRCRCGACAMCQDNAKWDRIFAKFVITEFRDVRGMFQSPLKDLC
jgi:hypothetical protein